MTLEGKDLYAYRAGFREWLYQRAQANHKESVGLLHITFTLADAEIGGTVISDHDPAYLARRIESAATRSTIDCFAVLEFGKRGSHRIHAHMLADDSFEARRLGAAWTESHLGMTVTNEVTDLIGVVTYVTKSIGPDSLFVVTGRYRHDGGVGSWLTRTGATRLPGQDGAAAIAGATLDRARAAAAAAIVAGERRTGSRTATPKLTGMGGGSIDNASTE